MVRVRNADECAEFTRRMLTDDSGRKEILTRADTILDANRGALDATVGRVSELIIVDE